MKLIVAGSRNITDYSTVEYCIKEIIKQSNLEIEEIVSGKAKGVDSLGEQYAKKYNIKTTEFPADWDKHGKSAGYLRNEEMAKYVDALLAIWDGQSKGTKHMINLAKKYKLKNIWIAKAGMANEN